MIIMGRYLGFMVKSNTQNGIQESDSCLGTPPGVMLQQPFHYRSLTYAAVCDINHIAESIILEEGKQFGDKNVGLKYSFRLLQILQDDCSV